MTNMILIQPPGAFEIILIVVVLLLLFGGKKIPELMRGLGQGIKEFKKATKNEEPPKNGNSEKTDQEKNKE
jgi:sec-independent protein translocase protein TatA